MDITSILVPSVQELAKEQLTKVPERYVLPDHETVVLSNTTSSPQVPVIDLAELLSQDINLKRHELEKLHYACKEWGFFQLVNHGISTSLVEDMKKGAKTLFELSMEEKKNLWQIEGEMEGFGQSFVLSEEQKLEWADTFFLSTLPPHLRKPYLFNQIPQSFRENLEVYSVELEKLAIKVIELMANALAINPKEMTELFNIGTQMVRVNYYPPCPQPERVIGLKSHSDAGGLTILLQTSDIDGLQIRKDGQWIPVKPLPNAFIVNIGDMLEIITNGIYPSIEHRATVNSEKERISVAAFYGPNMQAMLAPAPSLVTQERPAQFRRISVVDHFNGYFSQELRGKSYLNEMKITKSEE
ncbi:putative thebaine 6-O-demethylase [Medicago truncatula]|uniref:Putative thebaine 6-O-demethylase n=1 Tax=Medicago truncatula TaxID=3880 RepID=A0A396GUN0_MEDTR|nr:protein SRG1-like [Medicago truncatula]RHN42317.1 putative thebaine 6-O-demethylase [Medicago truncatula]